MGGSYYYVSINTPTQQSTMPSPKPTPIPTLQETPDSSPTLTIQPTIQPTPIPTSVPTTNPTPTPSPSSTPSPTPYPSLSPTPSTTTTATPTPTSTPTPTPTPTIIPITPKYSLQEAITAGYIEANITGVGLGASSGDSIVLELKRLTDYTIEIEKIPTGTLLVPTTDKQTMAVLDLKGEYTYIGYYPSTQIILDDTDKVSYLFSGYCVTFYKSNPTISTRFNIDGIVNADVMKIYNVLDQLSPSVASVSAIQTAIFVVTDNINQAELQNTFPTSAAEIENAKTILQTAGIDISTKNLFK